MKEKEEAEKKEKIMESVLGEEMITSEQEEAVLGVELKEDEEKVDKETSNEAIEEDTSEDTFDDPSCTGNHVDTVIHKHLPFLSPLIT